MQYKIYTCKNGFLLNIYYEKGHSESWVYPFEKRLEMLTRVETLMGNGPGSIHEYYEKQKNRN